MQPLEPRRLLSGGGHHVTPAIPLTPFAAVDLDGTLTVNGTTGDDTITVSTDGTTTAVVLNGTEEDFPNATYTALVVNGLDGDDSIALSANVIGATLNGGAGNDTLRGGIGADTFNGGDGIDTVDYTDRTADLTINLGGAASGENGGAEGDIINADVENVASGSGNDLIVGDSAANVLNGGAGNDTILGNDGNDTLLGGPGNDSLSGGNGDDTFLAADNQADTLDGGAGTNTATADATLDTITNIQVGTGAPVLAPGIAVSDNGSQITSGASQVSFGSVTVGAAAPTQTFAITNSGTAILTIGSVTVPTGFSLTDAPASALLPGATTTFTVSLDSDSAGSTSGLITFATNVTGSNPFNFTVSGSVVAPQVPVLTVLSGTTVLANGAPVPFGSVTAGGTAISKTFTVRNDGNATLTLGSLSVPAGFSVTDPLVGSLAPGATDTFTVQLNATAVGAPAGPITFTTNDPQTPSFSLAVAGTVSAAPAPMIAVSQGTTIITNNAAASIDFGNVIAGSAGPTLTFTIADAGNARLRLGSVTVPAGFTLVTAPPTSVAPGGSATFTVQLNSAAGVGDYSGQIAFATNDATASTFTINVHGTVVSAAEPHLSAFVVGRRGRLAAIGAGMTIPYGSVLVGAAAPSVTFDLRNDGTATLNLSTITVPAGFVITARPATTTLTVGSSVTFTVAMATTAAGTLSGGVSINSNAPQTPFIVNVSGTVATPTPQIAVALAHNGRRASPMTSAGGTIAFGTATLGGGTPAVTFVVSNVGTARLRTSTITVPTGFVIAKSVARYLLPGQTDTLVLVMATGTGGNQGGTASIYTSDVSHSPFNIIVGGTVAAPVGAGTGAAVTATFANGTLTVEGTPGDDDILIGGTTRAVTVTANDKTVGGSPFSGASKVIVDAGAGDDRVTLTAPINGTLNGDDGNDTLTGGPGNDVLNGGAGNDVLDGGDGNDELLGGDGNDTLTGGAGVDVMKGEAGNDTINAVDGIADSFIDGGLGADVIHKDRVDPWTGT